MGLLTGERSAPRLVPADARTAGLGGPAPWTIEPAPSDRHLIRA